MAVPKVATGAFPVCLIQGAEYFFNEIKMKIRVWSRINIATGEMIMLPGAEMG